MKKKQKAILKASKSCARYKPNNLNSLGLDSGIPEPG